jgi:outer membrane protein assembly factor BamB
VSGSATLEGGVIYVGTRSGSVYAVGLDGAERWRAGAGGTVLSKPAVAGGTVFVTTYGSHLVAFDAATGTVLGRYRADSAIYSSPAVDGGRVYFGSNGGVFVALWLVPTA